MKITKKTIVSLLTIALIGLMSSCVVVHHDHPHHHWHHGGVHEEIIVR